MSETLRYNLENVPHVWPFEEAAKVAHRLTESGKGHALFETGYGPSGLPHVVGAPCVRHPDWIAVTADRFQR
jgi:lysyl-tRNA synthetase class 1